MTMATMQLDETQGNYMYSTRVNNSLRYLN